VKAKYGDRLLPLALDVGNKAAVDATVEQAHKQFGHIDVAINKRRPTACSAPSKRSASKRPARRSKTNLFGALWGDAGGVCPLCGAQQSGHIIQISSIGGVWAGADGSGSITLPNGASKASARRLAGEVKDLGIKVTIVEPGGFATEWGTTSAHRRAAAAGL